MAISVYPAVLAKTSFKLSLISGTSWTVPAGVTNINVTCVGGGGGGAGTGQGATAATAGGVGGTTSFTGATSAVGGNGGPLASMGTPSNGITGPAQTPNTGKGGTSPSEAATSGSAAWSYIGFQGTDGQTIMSTLAVTAGASITYAIGAGGTAGGAGTSGGAAGTAGASGRVDIEYWA